MSKAWTRNCHCGSCEHFYTCATRGNASGTCALTRVITRAYRAGCKEYVGNGVPILTRPIPEIRDDGHTYRITRNKRRM